MALRRGLTASMLLVAFHSFLPVLALDPNVPTTCYVLDGESNLNAGFRCNNATTGHSSCCAAGAICYSNGVCAQSNDLSTDWLRVGCTDKTWSDPVCLEQCSTFFNASTAGIRFCNSNDITKTNKYCCDDGKFGPGSFKCCDNPASVFVINPVATILAQMPLSQLTTATGVAVTTTPAPTKTASSSLSTSTAASNNDGDMSHSAAIGAGIGVLVGLVALNLAVFLVWRQRKKQAPKAAELAGESVDGRKIVAQRMGAYGDSGSPQEMESNSPAASEDGGWKKGEAIDEKKGYFVERSYDEAPRKSTGGKDRWDNGQVYEMDGGIIKR